MYFLIKKFLVMTNFFIHMMNFLSQTEILLLNMLKFLKIPGYFA